VIDALGNVTNFEYDLAGNLVRIVEPGNLATTFVYDDENNLVQRITPGGNVTRFIYDDTFNQIDALLDPRSITTDYVADAEGNITRLNFADGTFTQRVFDTLGRISSITNRRGQTATFSYDADNRPTSIARTEGTTSFAYDARSNITSATLGSETTQFVYDGDKITSVTYASGKSIQYSYDTQGRLSRMEDQDGFAVNYTYDAAGRISTVTDAASNTIVSYSYDTVGRLATKTNGDGSSTEYTYDAAGKVTSIVHKNPGGAVRSQVAYDYDARGNIISATTADGTTTYTYDANRQLTQVVLPGGRTITYAYDAAGNRTSKTDSGVTAAYTVNNMNEITAAGTTTYTYDDEGSLITKTTGGVTTTYTYNSARQLISASSPAETITYEYDPMGLLTAVVRDGVRTDYLVDPTGITNIFAQYDDGDLVAHYVRGNGLASQIDSGGAAFYYHTDAGGNVTQLTSAGGTVINEYEYLPFGEELSAVEGRQNPFGFAGETGALDIGHGRLFMRNRTYDPSLGRFVETDPIDLEGGETNLYLYASNNPVNYIDPLGLVRETGPNGPTNKADQLNGLLDSIVDTGTRVVVGTGEVGLGAGLFYWGTTEAAAFAPTVTTVVSSNVGTGIGGASMVYGTSGAVTTSTITTSAGLGTSVASAGAAPIIIGGTIAAGGGWLIGSGLRQIPLVDNTAYSIACKFNTPERADILGPRTRNGLEDGIITFNSASSGTGGSNDPNDIIGPAGYGPGRHITDVPTLDYTIRFENLNTATLPAQDVFITHTLDADLDLSTFSFGDFGFGDLTFDVPDGLSSYFERIDLRDTLGIFVDATFELNFATRVASWTFRTIDPVTLDLTADPLAGFLPPNVTSPEGEGFVSYAVRTNDALPSGTTIDQQARIIFDLNDPIDTPVWTNTIDAGVPSSSVSALPEISTSADVLVSWTGADDAGGSGAATFDIFVSDNGGPFVLWLDDTPATSATWSGEDGHTYAFYSVARDGVGFTEADPGVADTQTTIDAEPGPDLTVEVTGNLPDSVIGGKKRKLKARVTNAGDARMRKSRVNVEFYLSTDSVLDASDRLIGSKSKRFELKAGKRKTIEGKFRLPSDLADGTYFILAVVDPNDAIDEKNNANNAAASAQTIAYARPVVDLAGVFSTISDTSLDPKDRLRTSLRIRNDGNVSGGKSRWQVFASLDDVLSDDDVLLFEGRVKSSISAGKSKKFNLSRRADRLDLEPGTYRLIAVLDTRGAVDEPNEANNTVFSSEQIVLV
jgi:RHS repeat-associated protein